MKNKARKAAFAAPALLVMGVVAIARSTPQGPTFKTFVSGDVARAEDVNDNFTIVKGTADQAAVDAELALQLINQSQAQFAGAITVDSDKNVQTNDLTVEGNLTDQLTGTVGVVAGNNVVVGSGTLFTTELELGDVVKIGDERHRVAAITSDTLLDLDANHLTGALSGTTAFIDKNLVEIKDGLGTGVALVDGQGRFRSTAAAPGLAAAFQVVQGDSGWTMGTGTGDLGGSRSLGFRSFDEVTALVLKPDGNVGIGTTVPGGRLHVRDAVANFIFDGSTTTSGYTTRVVMDDSALTIGHNSQSRNLTLATNSQPRLTIIGSGDVGINNTNPQFRLDVNGDAHRADNSPSWTVQSDERLKKNIHELGNALDTVLALHGVSFEYKDPKLPGERIGFIAQDVERVLPDWVDEGPDGYKRLTLRGFEALAVEAFRELKHTCAAKDAEISALRMANSRLEERVVRLESIEAEVDSLKASLQALLDDR